MSIEEQERLNYLNNKLENVDDYQYDCIDDCIEEFLEFFELADRYAKLKAKKGIKVWY